METMEEVREQQGVYCEEGRSKFEAGNRYKIRKKANVRILFTMLWIGLMLLCTGCSIPFLGEKEEQGEPWDFIVLSKEVIPKEVLEEIEKRGTEQFQFTFQDGNHLYVCVGYGAQKGQGYSICVDECTRKKEILYVNMTLLGPEAGKGSNRGISYPYIVIQTENTDLPVVVE